MNTIAETFVTKVAAMTTAHEAVSAAALAVRNSVAAAASDSTNAFLAGATKVAIMEGMAFVYLVGNDVYVVGAGGETYVSGSNVLTELNMRGYPLPPSAEALLTTGGSATASFSSSLPPRYLTDMGWAESAANVPPTTISSGSAESITTTAAWLAPLEALEDALDAAIVAEAEASAALTATALPTPEPASADAGSYGLLGFLIGAGIAGFKCESERINGH